MYVKPKSEFKPPPVSGGKDLWSRRLQYLYFLRFCVLGWLLLPLFCLLDGCTGASSITRGIMTLSSGWQAFHTAFFVVTLLVTTLVCARNLVMNGKARFESDPPPRLYQWLTSCEPRLLWTVLGLALVPAVVTLLYVACTTIREQVGFAGFDPGTWPGGGWHWRLWAWYGAGLGMAFVFWYLVTLFYLWTHEWKVGDGPRALIFPVLIARAEERMQASAKPQMAEWLEAVLRVPLQFTYKGYAEKPDGPLWELHFLATVSLGAFVLLYLMLYPLVAPVVTTQHPGAEIALAAVICVAFVAGARKTKSWWEIEAPGIFFSVLFLMLLGAFLGFMFYDMQHGHVQMERAFPVLASVTVILIFVQWGINGASFLFDRYRLPVMTVLIAAIFLPKLVLSFVPPSGHSAWVGWVQAHVVDWDADHYLEVRRLAQPLAVLPTPSDAVTQRVTDDSQPYVVVTATGGGIQAAEWTAQVMARLETEFHNDQELNGYTLHDHLLLASGVSGGSVGLVPYLLEYTAPAGQVFPASDELDRRLTMGPGCSSLEAVAWGLEYYDLQRLMLTVRLPLLQSAQDAPDDATAVAPDRTWALSRALNRNLNDHACNTDNYPGLPRILNAEQMTLGQSAQRLSAGSMPAFTLNTTVAETGGRFLLANYMVPQAQTSSPLNTEFLPSASFLQVYAQGNCCSNGPDGERMYADLPLATAARLSATFPVVSSATRVPMAYGKTASHFLDGGYFDNDGTASAIEFLYSVMNARPADAKPLKVLLVEIRDGDDLDPNVDPDDLQHQTGATVPTGSNAPSPWWTVDQMMGPLEGLWNAGHVSVTRRNRRELCVLETAYAKGLTIHHVVFAIPRQLKPGNQKETDRLKTAPLSWKLTASQLAYITAVARGTQFAATDQSVKDALNWVAMAQKGTPASEVCHTDNVASR